MDRGQKMTLFQIHRNPVVCGEGDGVIKAGWRVGVGWDESVSKPWVSWTAAGNEVPRRFRADNGFIILHTFQSGVVASLCHRSP